MKTHILDFREFVRNDPVPKIGLDDVKTYSFLASSFLIGTGVKTVFYQGYVIIGITCFFALAIAIFENRAMKSGNDQLAETIVKFMKVFMPLTLIIALIILGFFNPLL